MMFESRTSLCTLLMALSLPAVTACSGSSDVGAADGAAVEMAAVGIPNTVAFGDCWLNLDAHTLRGADAREIPITAHEFVLLSAFAQRPRRVPSRETLFNLVYDRNWRPADRSIDLKVSRLRRKIENNSAMPDLIKTVHGEGYVYSSGRPKRV